MIDHPPSSVTRAVRASIATDPVHGAVVPPLHLSTTFAFAGFGRPRTYDYTRSGNPTRSQLADALAELEGGAGAVVTSTGMSAITLVLHQLKRGDTVVAAHDCYGGTQRLLRSLEARGHYRVVFANLTVPHGAEVIAAERPAMVWIETPSNPLLRITDVAAVAAAAKAEGALVVVDNTFLSPALQQPLALGADVVVHSTTKYLNGHSDLVGGAVVAADAARAADLAWWANCLGITGAPFDSWLTLRGVRTLFARMPQHVANAEAIVEALLAHPAVLRVHYPGIESHPGHDIARRQQAGFGAMVSFELEGGSPAVERFVSALQLFTLAESLGGVESLVAHPATMTHASMDADAREAAGISDGLVRLSVGIEAAGDLVRDLRRALSASTPEPVRHIAITERRPAANVVLLGAGTIGRELLGQVTSNGHHAGAPFRICGVADRTGFVCDARGLSDDLLRTIRARKLDGGSLAGATEGRAGSASDLIDVLAPHAGVPFVLVDATTADTHDVLRHAFSAGWHAVLANKVPLSGDQSRVDTLWREADLHGCLIRYEATVGAGLPVIDTLQKLLDSGDEILAIEGCPSGTLGFLFGELGAGRAFSEALADAVARRLTEPDPRVDLSGVDVARKALILGRLIGYRGNVGDIAVESLLPASPNHGPADAFLERAAELDAAWSARVAEAAANGCVLRYRACVTPAQITVGLVPVPHGSPLAALSGTDNQFAITTVRYDRQPIVITGPGAGPPVTAAGVYIDLRAIAVSPLASPILLPVS
jgi:cystathionine gamma-synthase